MLTYFFISILVCQSCCAIIYHLNNTEYARMPPIFLLDRYEACLHAENGSGVYCSVRFDLVADEPNELYTLITDYSAKTNTHFNHSKLSYGICLTKTCKQFYQHNTTADPRLILEACLNKTFWENYKLKTRVTDKYTCETYNKEMNWDTSDYAVAIALAILLLLNLIGSLQEFYLCSEDDTKGNDLLSCFSIRRNWKKLVAPAGEGLEARLKNLVWLNAIKAIFIAFVVLGHGAYLFAINADNTQFQDEGIYESEVGKLILVFAMHIVQFFFLLTSFLFSSKLCLYQETHQMTWTMLLKCMLARWLRFTPAYVVTLAITATLLRHSGSGPLFQEVIMNEVEHCRRDWWINLLYINNYVDSHRCLLQSWYIAADFQLFTVVLTVFLLPAARWRMIALALLFLAGVALPAVQTYIQDLDGLPLLSPENSRNFFELYPTFDHVYKRAHSYLSLYAIGISAGWLFHHLQSSDYKCNNKILRMLFYLIVPIAAAVFYSGTVFYSDAPRQSAIVRSVFASIVKPLLGILFAFFAFGMIFFENLNRDFLQWPGWRVPARLSFSVYLVHLTVIRVLSSTSTTTIHVSFLHVIATFSSSLVLSILVAIPFHILVEAPFSQLMKIFMLALENVKKHIEDKNDINNTKDGKVPVTEHIQRGGAHSNEA